MRTLLYLLIALGLAIGLGLLVKQDPGYLLLSFKEWTVEMPLWLGAALLIAFTIALYFLIKFLSFLFSANQKIKTIIENSRRKSARESTTQGLIELAEGHWKKAEKLLIKGVKHSETPLINYLSAAKAAQEQGQDERRDDYLRLGSEFTSGTEVAVGLTQAELQLKHRQYEQCLATLMHLKQISNKHPHVLKLLTKVYIELKEWKQLIDLLPGVKKAKIFPEQVYLNFERQAYLEEMKNYTSKSSTEALQYFWHNLPQHIQNAPENVKYYAKTLMTNNNHPEAELLLRIAIRKQWSDELVDLYSFVKGANPVKQLAVAEGWRKSHQQNPTLLLCLGRLALRNKLWGKAASYFNESLTLEERPETYCELGRLYELTEDKAQATEFFRKGLFKAVEVLPM